MGNSNPNSHHKGEKKNNVTTLQNSSQVIRIYGSCFLSRVQLFYMIFIYDNASAFCFFLVV